MNCFCWWYMCLNITCLGPSCQYPPQLQNCSHTTHSHWLYTLNCLSICLSAQIYHQPTLLTIHLSIILFRWWQHETPTVTSPETNYASIAIAPSKHHNHSRSPSKLVINPSIPLSPLLPTIPPKPSHHITSTLIKQSLQVTKAAQTMKKPEEQLEREQVMQVLKSSSTVSGAYSLAGASVTNSSVVVGTHIYNQHQYQHQQRRRPSLSGNRWNGKIGYAASSRSSGSDEHALPLPKQRMH